MTAPNTSGDPGPVDTDGLPQAATQQGEDKLRDRLFGVALFFSALEILFESQPQMLDTYRRQCRNLIQRGYAALDHAERTPGESGSLPDFVAGGGAAAAEDRQLLARADSLVSAYRELFPRRDRSEALSRDDLLSLMEAAALKAPLS